MFIDNPRDHSIQRLSEVNEYTSGHRLEEDQIGLYEEKEGIKTSVENKIKQLSIAKIPLVINISGESGSPLKVTVKTPDNSFEVLSDTNLVNTGNESLDYTMIFKRLKAINDTEYYIEKLNLDDLQPEVYLPFKELTAIKRRLLFILNDSRETADPVHVPAFRKQNREKIKPLLSVLISSPKDLYLGKESTADIYFQLPDSFKNECAEYVNLFRKNEKLIPWFPSVLIGDDYSAAVELLEQVQPKLIVTNNTGIAYEAFQKGINWIAGPHLNIANSFSLLCLKEDMNCSGAFISNEIGQTQIRQLNKPEGFKLYYSIYHPIVLMTSRQCLFHQVVGCQKEQIDDTCISHCEKSATITNLKNEKLFLEKSKGNYHRIFNDENFQNTEIITDLPDLFSGFLIDLQDIKTGTQTNLDKSEIIKKFENLLCGNPDSKTELQEMIHHTTNAQYKRGI